jgi:predicted transposase YbfD/YdcC
MFGARSVAPGIAGWYADRGTVAKLRSNNTFTLERSLRMEAQAPDVLLRFFRSIQDPRAANAWHRLNAIMAIAIMAVLCGAESWPAVETWGRANLDWLQTFLDLPHGIPTHDTFDRVFAMLDPLAFEACFTKWTGTLIKNSQGLFVAVDGKTLRRSFKHAWSKTPVHLVSAFVSKNQLLLGQLATDCKSNEITAIPRLLAMLELAGATVSIDAMGCQREIAAQILRQKGHYILAVKDNQPTLYTKVKALLDEAIADGFAGMQHGYAEETDDGHGRIETRRVWVTSEVRWLGEELLELWPGLGCVVAVESIRQDLSDPEGKISTERRYFISSHDGTDVKLLAEGIRAHWGVENGLHWCLDVSMNEDQCRLRVAHGAENFSRLRRIALNKLKRWQITKENGKVMHAGIRLKQQACGWSRKFLIQALLA